MVTPYLDGDGVFTLVDFLLPDILSEALKDIDLDMRFNEEGLEGLETLIRRDDLSMELWERLERKRGSMCQP